MSVALEERIGGNLPATAVHQLYELMQHAPVKPAIQILELRVNLAFQILQVEEKEIIWTCLDSWLEVRRHGYRTSKSSRETDDEVGCFQYNEGRKTPQ